MRWLLLVLLFVGCGTRAPGDPFGWSRPEELVTVCHDGSTMQFNRSMAHRHLKHHKNDTRGLCPPRVPNWEAQ